MSSVNSPLHAKSIGAVSGIVSAVRWGALFPMRSAPSVNAHVVLDKSGEVEIAAALAVGVADKTNSLGERILDGLLDPPWVGESFPKESTLSIDLKAVLDKSGDVEIAAPLAVKMADVGRIGATVRASSLGAAALSAGICA